MPTPSADASDEALMARAASDGPGASAAFAELFERCMARVYRFVCGMLGPGPDGEDAAAEVLVRVWRNRHAYARGRAWRPWLFGIARHVCRDALRRRDRRREAPLPPGASIPAPGPGPEGSAARSEMTGRLRAAMAALPVDHREILMLRYFERLAAEEAADVLGVPVGTARSRLSRALGALRDELGTIDASL